MKIVETKREYIVTDGDEKVIITYNIKEDKLNNFNIKVSGQSNIVTRAKEVIRQSLINEACIPSNHISSVPLNDAVKEELEATKFANRILKRINKLFPQ